MIHRDAQLHSVKRQKRDNYNPHNTASSSRSQKYNFDFEHNIARPPQQPHRPRNYPRTLKILSHDWVISVRAEGDYEPYEWGLRGVYCDKNRILIYMKIREAERCDSHAESSVSIEIEITPDMQRIHKIESLYKHRMQTEGIDEQLLVPVFLNQTPKAISRRWTSTIASQDRSSSVGMCMPTNQTREAFASQRLV